MKVYIFLSFFLMGFINAHAQSVHSCFGKNLVEQINSYQTPNLVKTPTQTFNSLTELQSKINSKTDHNGAVYALAAGTHKGELKIIDKRNLCVYTNPNNPATINAAGKNFGINAYNSKQGVNSNIEILNFRIKGSKFHGIYLGGDKAPRFAPRGMLVAGNEVFDVAHTVGGGIVVRNALDGALIKIESNEVYGVSPSNLGSSGEGIYIGEGNDPQHYSNNIHIIGNYLHDLTGEAIDIKRKSADILMEYNRINNINVKSQSAVVLGLDPGKANDSYDAKFIFRRNSISNITTRGFDGNFIVVSNGSTLIEENVMWNAVKHGIDVYTDCDGPNKNVKIQNNILWGYKGLPVRINVGNANGGTKDPCSVSRTTNMVQSNPVGSECQVDASVFKGPLTSFEGFAPSNTNNPPPNEPPTPPVNPTDCNLLSNGDFGNGLTDWSDWRCNTNSASGACRITDIETGSKAWNAALAQGNFSLENGEQYEISFDASAIENSRTVRVKVGLSESPYTTFFAETITINTNSRQFSMPFTMKHPTTNKARLEIQLGLSSIGVIVDNMQLKLSNENCDSNCDQVKNGNFTNGTVDWRIQKCTATIANNAIDIDVPYKAQNFWEIGVKQPGFLYEKGKQYRVSFKAKADANRNIYVKNGKSSSPYTTYHMEKINLTTALKQYSYIFTMNNTTDNNGYFEFLLGESDIDLHLSNISLGEANCTGSFREGLFNDSIADLTIYPNPVIEQLNISLELTNNSKMANIRVFDLLGNLLLEEEKALNGANNFQFDVDFIPAGKYLLQVKVDNQDYPVTKKIIKF